MKPLKPAVFHILLALAERDLHGYAVMQTVREQSGGRVPLQTGSFYRHLSRIVSEGWVAEAPNPREVEDARRGVHYRLTTTGRLALDRERLYLSSLLGRFSTTSHRARKRAL